MKLYIKQRMFSFSDTFDIYDESGDAKYFVKGEVFSFGHQMHVFDCNQYEVGMISQRILTLLPKFDIFIDGENVGYIEKEFTFFKPTYNIHFYDWYVEGDLFGWDYDVYCNGSRIAHISKEIFNWTDTYVIDIFDDSDELMALMLVIAIDCANCKD